MKKISGVFENFGFNSECLKRKTKSIMKRKSIMMTLTAINIVLFTAIILASCVSVKAYDSTGVIGVNIKSTETEFKKTIKENGFKNIKIYDNEEINDAVLKNRLGKTVVRRIVGIVSDNNKNGIILNAKQGKCTLNYKTGELPIGECNIAKTYNQSNIHKGETIVTYIIYSPYSNDTSDVLYRYDIRVQEGISK